MSAVIELLRLARQRRSESLALSHETTLTHACDGHGHESDLCDDATVDEQKFRLNSDQVWSVQNGDCDFSALQCDVARRLHTAASDQCDGVVSVVVDAATASTRRAMCACGGRATRAPVMAHTEALYETLAIERARYEQQDRHFDGALQVLCIDFVAYCAREVRTDPLVQRCEAARPLLALLSETAGKTSIDAARAVAPHLTQLVSAFERTIVELDDAHTCNRRDAAQPHVPRLRSMARAEQACTIVYGALKRARRLLSVDAERREAYDITCSNMNYLYVRVVQHFVCHFNVWALASLDNRFDDDGADWHCSICTERYVNTYVSPRNRLVLHCCDYKQHMCVGCFFQTAYSDSKCARLDYFHCAFCKTKLPLYN